MSSPVTLGAGNYWLIWQTDNNNIGVAYARALRRTSSPATRMARHLRPSHRVEARVPTSLSMPHSVSGSKLAANGGDAGLRQP